MIRFPQRQRSRQLLPKESQSRLGAAIGSTEQEPEPGSQQQQDTSPEYRPPLPPRAPRSHTYQASGRVHPRSPSQEQDGSGSNKRPKLDEARKSEPGKFSTALSSLDNRGRGTAFDDDGNFRYAGEPGPSMLGSAMLGGGCVAFGSGQDGEHHRHHHQQQQQHQYLHQMGAAHRQELLNQLCALEAQLAQMVNWKKSAEEKHTRMSRARRLAEQRLEWLRREEGTVRHKLAVAKCDMRMVEERRAQVLRDLAATDARPETALNRPEGLESGRGSGSGNGNGNRGAGAGAGGEMGVNVTDAEMMG